MARSRSRTCPVRAPCVREAEARRSSDGHRFVAVVAAVSSSKAERRRASTNHAVDRRCPSTPWFARSGISMSKLLLGRLGERAEVAQVLHALPILSSRSSSHRRGHPLQAAHLARASLVKREAGAVLGGIRVAPPRISAKQLGGARPRLRAHCSRTEPGTVDENARHAVDSRTACDLRGEPLQ